MIATATYILTNAFNVPTRLKKYLGYNMLEVVKPFDCTFCWSMWCAIPFWLINWKVFFLNTVISYIIDRYENKV